MAKQSLYVNLWEKVVFGVFVRYFSGSNLCKLDSKGRFVLPIQMRHGLVEEGELQFAVGLGLGGSLAIYPSSVIDQIVSTFRKKMHLSQYQRFFTLFFSTLHRTTCDAVGRVTIPPMLKKAAKLEGEIVVAGVMDKIEIWPKERYEKSLEEVIEGSDLEEMSAKGFALLQESSVEEEGIQAEVSG